MEEKDFSKNGRSILSGITSGKTEDEIIENLSPNVRKKNTQIRGILDREISKALQSDFSRI
jgi:hypothetical protein